jgi:UDP-N-acetylmuramate--alanine ligase
VEDRNQFVDAVKSHFTGNDVLLLMGARDPGLEKFAGEVFEKL